MPTQNILEKSHLKSGIDNNNQMKETETKASSTLVSMQSKDNQRLCITDSPLNVGCVTSQEEAFTQL